MTPDFEAAIIINDLSSLVYRIESLAAHPEYTTALIAVQTARDAMSKGRSDIHQRTIKGEWGP